MDARSALAFSTALHAASSVTPGQYQLTKTKDGKPFQTTTQCFTSAC